MQHKWNFSFKAVYWLGMVPRAFQMYLEILSRSSRLLLQDSIAVRRDGIRGQLTAIQELGKPSHHATIGSLALCFHCALHRVF